MWSEIIVLEEELTMMENNNLINIDINMLIITDYFYSVHSITLISENVVGWVIIILINNSKGISLIFLIK